MKTFLKILCGFALLAGWLSCEKVTFPEPDPEGQDTEQPEDTLVLEDAGEGSLQAPATVNDLLLRPGDFLGRACWVAGYIVGYTERTMKNASFMAEGAVQSNILLADDPGEMEPDFCVPVELKTDKWKTALSLAHQPENLGKRVAVHGLVKTYFSVTGVRSMESFRWLQAEEGGGGISQEPEEPQNPQEPDQPDEPEDPEEPDLPDETPEKEPFLIYLNETLLQQVEQGTAIGDGRRYMLGTVPEASGAVFVASSLKYGPEIKYRTVLPAVMTDGRFRTELGVAPAVFVLEQQGSRYRLRDELTGGYLAYDVRGDASSASWIPLYTLMSEDLNANFCADFRIRTDNLSEQLSTAEKVKFSSASSVNCLLRYNPSGNNFKLNFHEANGKPVCLYLIK